MALIQPQGKIQLFNALKLDSSYENTYYFSTLSEQTSFFDGLVAVTYNNQSYSRKNGSLYVQAVADNIYSCNYMRFQNAGFGLKWFYAFITNIEYVSNTVSKIDFELDVIQTWFFNFNLNGNFIERIHTQSDKLYEHIESDIAPFGDDYVYNKTMDFDYSDMKVLLHATETPEGLRSVHMFSNIGSTLTESIFNLNNQGLNSLLRDIDDYASEGKLDAIVNIFQAPTFCTQQTEDAPATDTKQFSQKLTDLDGYDPKNKKCFCYPYNFLLFSNRQGANSVLRFEDFINPQENNYTFTVRGCTIPTPQILMYPRNHKRILRDYESGIAINNFPTCGFGGDVYKNYLAQHRNQIALSAISSTVSLATNVATKNGGGVANDAMNLANMGANYMDGQNLPKTIKGQLFTDGLLAGLNRYGYTLYQKCLNEQTIRQVDNFFTRYGYAINRIVDNVNRHARPKFTYVKTKNCSIYGNIPANDCRKIEELHNRGITYWRSTAIIGDFTDNQPS